MQPYRGLTSISTRVFSQLLHFKIQTLFAFMLLNQVRRQRGGRGGIAPPIFISAPPIFISAPPIYFLPSTVFFLKSEHRLFLAGKTVWISDFGQKKPSDFGEDLFF